MPPGSSARTRGESHVALELGICPADIQMLGEVDHGTPATGSALIPSASIC